MKIKMVRGVGVNDADYQVYMYEKVDGKQKQIWICPMYRVWTHMLDRCYSTKLQASYPTYIGCTVVPEWLSFSVFRYWMQSQPWERGYLDKDILAKGNKAYGPDTCVFVSGTLNNFLNDNRAARGQYPVGVSLKKDMGKLQAKCCNPFSAKEEHLGYFDCPDAAHEAWRARKHELACRYADMQTDPRIAAALRTRYIQQEGVQ